MNPSSSSTSSSERLLATELGPARPVGVEPDGLAPDRLRPAPRDVVPVLEPPPALGDRVAGADAELAGVKRLLRRGLLFGLPFGLYALFVFVADPFDFVNRRSPVDARVKAETATQLNPAFWKMNQFARRPAPNILLGDSRMWLLDADDVTAVAGEDYVNLAYGGGTLREAIDTFWFAAKRTGLRKVYLGVSLDTYNETNYTERTKLFPAVKANPALYFVNRTVLQAAVYDVYSQLTKTDLKLGEPPMDRDAFWQYQLQHGLTRYFERYVYPTRYRRELGELGRYCAQHGIQLTFVIFPSNLDAQRLMEKHQLGEARERLRRDLAALATVYDFDYENDITRHRENFTDPVHFTKPVAAQLIREIWGPQVRYARTLSARP